MTSDDIVVRIFLGGKVQENSKRTRVETLEINSYLRAQHLERRRIGIDFAKQVEGTVEPFATGQI
jgi:hypothetical protein